MHAFREAANAVRRAPFLTILSAAMVALALYVVGIFGVATFNLHQALQRIEERVEVVAYLRDAVRPSEITTLEEDVLRMEEVRGVRFVSREDALEVARRDLPEFEELFVGLDSNPLPASLEIELHEGFRTPNAVARVAERLTIYPFVEDVRYGQEWVDRLYLLQRIGGLATIILGGAFAVVAALIIGTAIRIAIFARREEIFVMRLVGATNGFVRRPFLLEGAFTGALGGIMAAGFTWVTYQLISRAIFRLDWVPVSWILGGVVAGALFGLMASGLAVRRYLQEV
ncbi:ABC transporter permease [soil metagenome]